MEGIKITTDNTIEKIELPFRNVLPELQKHVGGGFVERVKPAGLRATDYVMLVNDNGISMGLPDNATGSGLYRHRIVGDIVIMKEGWTREGVDFVDFKPGEADRLIEEFRKQMPLLCPKKGPKKQETKRKESGKQPHRKDAHQMEPF